MTAAVGFPTLRLIRYAIGQWSLDNLNVGESRLLETHITLPAKSARTARSQRAYQQRTKKRGIPR